MKIKPLTTEDQSSNQQQETEKLIQSKKKPRPFLLGIFLSVRLFLIIVITLLVIATALSIWIAAYKVNEQAALEAVSGIMTNINDKVRQFLDGQLVPLQVVSQQLRDDYQNGYIDTADGYLRYFYSKLKQNNITIVTLCLGENGADTLYGYTGEDGIISTLRKRQGDKYLLKLATDENGDPTSKIQLNITYVVPKRDFYLESAQFFTNGYPDGGFGTVNQIPSGHMTIYYASQVFARNSTSKIGIAKINLTFQQIAQFFAGIKVLENGYSILSEYGNDMIIGCSLPIPNIEKTRIKAQNITIRNAGKVFTKMLQANTEISYIQEGSENLIVSTTSYTFKNLKWRLTLVFDENEIKKGIITSSYVIAGVTIGVICIGVVLSVVIGWIVTNPFIQLQKDFKKIEVLDLTNIKPRNSIFTESKSIYSSLTDTVNWLAEFRAFLPDCVLNQLEQNQENQAEESATNPNESHRKAQESSSSIASKAGSGLDSFRHGSTFRNPKGGVAAMLKLGLSSRHSCVLYMRIPALNNVNISDVEILNSTVCKVITGVSSICKTVRGDLQIKSHNEYLVVFSDKNCSLTGLETSLKITTALNSLNETLIRNGASPLKANIAIASGECLQGNVGNNSLRFFTLVGEMIYRARNLSIMCEDYGVSVIVDQETHDENKDSFVYRPVDRYLGGDRSISTVYELIKKNQINADEWLYELEQQKENTKYEIYSQQFTKLFSQPNLETHDLSAIKKVLEENQIPNDKLMERLIRIIDKSCLNNHRDFANYHSHLKSSIDTYIDHNIPLHLE
ncbi:predicted protein [Naegleria gruberi]|uniref:Predicted protein n=1 Tax=Naegleria gruberi TaxID=5762 RepID=D2W3B1_NAEGR|nr:uncharacterized protein NAEGRDRAFT_75884 [Naegleria gruberi]EFC36458.1 predicted protein [Naegleria gruberi]|eukprot:XP_002669202.1 predicted protein [Naegleria gruberi strain NEG-M]